jgi:predicted site-specific integrase-resolvase
MLEETEIKKMDQQWKRKKFLTDAELCEMMRVSPQTTRRWRQTKKITFIKTPSGAIRYTPKHVEEFESRFEQRARP